MNKVTIYRFSLILSIFAGVAGAAMKILHYPHSNFLLPFGLIMSLVYICIGLYDSFLDKKEPNIIKLMWLVGFVVLSWIVGLLYLPKLKKNQQNK
jgi:hypothetical protein